MRAIIRCRGNRRFRLIFIDESRGLKTGYDVSSFLSLRLLLAMATHYSKLDITLECNSPERDKVIEILNEFKANIGEISEENRRGENG